MKLYFKENHSIRIGILLAPTCIETAPNNRHTKSIRSRSTLIELARSFTMLNRPSPKDLALFREQFYTLILNTDAKERKVISQELSHSEYAPKPIIIFFAMEEIAVANFPLAYSPVIQPADINLILKKCSFAHVKIIARRNNLDLSNIKALLKLDDDTGQIKNILKENTTLKNNDEISELLSPSIASDGWANKPAKVTTIQNERITKPKVTKASKDLSETLLSLANKGGKLERKKPTGKPVKAVSYALTLKQMENNLLALARAKDIQNFSSSIEDYCGLHYLTTFNLLSKQDAGKLATLLCALEITDITAARILLMMNQDIGRNAHIFRVVMEKYQNLSHDECVTFFQKLGADFSQTHVVKKQDHTATRYALSLAARDRRAALQKQSDSDKMHESYIKLTA